MGNQGSNSPERAAAARSNPSPTGALFTSTTPPPPKQPPHPPATDPLVPAQAGGPRRSGRTVDGKRSRTPAVSDHGPLPGPYKVTVTSVAVDTTELKAIAKGGPFHHDKTFAKAVRNASPLPPMA